MYVASDIGVDQKYLSSQNILSQSYMDNICNWTKKQKMKLNEEKSKVMLINFTKKYQFRTRIHMNGTLLETVKEAKILGLILTDNLSWRKNTDNLISKANARMIIIRNLRKFPISTPELVNLYSQFIRSILEFNSSVWFSSLS